MNSLEKTLEETDAGNGKQYIFLYPFREYFESMLNFCKTFYKEGHSVDKLNDIITSRYRSKGYGINWVLFSDENDHEKPDTKGLSGFVAIEKEDRILNAGVSFGKHVSEELYADNDFILNQLPVHKELVIGGFHQGDCVDKLAARSYSKGIKTFVDEDTTEMFFWRETFRGIPLIREKWRLGDLVSKDLYADIKESRQEKPWLVGD